MHDYMHARLHADLGKPAAGGKAPEAVSCLPDRLQFETCFLRLIGQQWH
jgi:hypothetical protein